MDRIKKKKSNIQCKNLDLRDILVSLFKLFMQREQLIFFRELMGKCALNFLIKIAPFLFH